MILILSLGLLIQFSVIFSLMYLMKLPTITKLQAVELCPRYGSSVERVVILIGNKIEPKVDAARAEVDFGSNVFQWNAMRCIFQGIPERYLLGPAHAGIQSKVVYIGPRSAFKDIDFSQDTLTSFYGNEENSKCPRTLEQDRLNHILEALSRFSQSETFKEFTCGKTLFILYFSTSPLVTNITDSYLVGSKTLEKLETLEKRMQDIFPDNRTLYLMLPDFRYAGGAEDVQLWGTAVEKGYHLPMKLQDFCPLLSVALGLEIPLYSHGTYHKSLLNLCPMAKSHWVVHNALQLHQLAFQCNGNKEIKKLKCATCENDIEIIDKCADTIRRLSIDELSSIQHNLHVYVHSSVVISLFAWILVILSEICKRYLGESLQVFLPWRILIGIVSSTLLGVASLDYVLHKILSFSYLDICFYNLPMVPILILFLRIKLILKWWELKSTLSLIYLTVSGIVTIVILSLCMEGGYVVCFISSLVPFLTVFPYFKNCLFVYQTIWASLTFCICLLLLSRSYTTADISLKLINISGIIWMCIGGASMFFIRGRRNHYISGVLIFYLLVSTVLAATSQGLDSHFDWIRTSSWLLLSGTLLPLFGSRRSLERFVHTSLSFAVPIFLQTKELEPLSFAFLLAFNLAWIYLEASHLHILTEHCHQLRRGGLLFFTLILGFQFAGKIEYNNFYSKEEILFLKNAFDHFSYSLMVAFKYLIVFISVLMVYLSLIKFKQPSDSSFLYCYLLAEGMCLNKLLQFYFLRREANQEIFSNMVANLFTSVIVFAYFLAHIYAAPHAKEKKKEDGPIQNVENTS